MADRVVLQPRGRHCRHDLRGRLSHQHGPLRGQPFLLQRPYSNGNLAVPASGGVYSYGGGSLPTKSYQASNYWVDVVFSARRRRRPAPVRRNAVASVSPAVTSLGPASGATGVATNASVTVTFNEALDVTTINSGTVYLSNGGAAVAATVAYNAANNTVTLTPASSRWPAARPIPST